MCEKPTTQTALFKAGQDWKNNAMVNYHKSWSTYAFGYWQAAKFLAENAAGIGMQDPFVYPIAFLYRHHLEIRFKELILLANQLLDKAPDYPKTHGLHVLWSTAKELILQIWPEEPEEFKLIDDIILAFNKIDQYSDAFRYPMGKKGNESLEGIHHINLTALSETLEKAAWFLDAACGEISENLQSKAEYCNVEL